MMSYTSTGNLSSSNTSQPYTSEEYFSTFFRFSNFFLSVWVPGPTQKDLYDISKSNLVYYTPELVFSSILNPRTSILQYTTGVSQ